MIGTIFDIREFTLHDGPGIRETVFLKGCPLRCSWCHNPEGLSFDAEIRIKKDLCMHCGNCGIHSPEIQLIGNQSSIAPCAYGARCIAGEEIEPKALAERLLKHAAYLTKSGGGITISGGEPLAQPSFLMETLSFLHGVHTTLDTSGYASGEVFEEAIARIDLVLFDIKHTDAALHMRYTGVDIHPILNNLSRLMKSRTHFRVRLPIIPGVNDTEEHFRAVGLLLHGAKNLDGVDILPYHKTAGAKYTSVGRIYSPGFDTERTVMLFSSVLDQYDIESVVQ